MFRIWRQSLPSQYLLVQSSYWKTRPMCNICLKFKIKTGYAFNNVLVSLLLALNICDYTLFWSFNCLVWTGEFLLGNVYRNGLIRKKPGKLFCKKKMKRKISQYSKETHWSLFLIKLQAWRSLDHYFSIELKFQIYDFCDWFKCE